MIKSIQFVYTTESGKNRKIEKSLQRYVVYKHIEILKKKKNELLRSHKRFGYYDESTKNEKNRLYQVRFFFKKKFQSSKSQNARFSH